MTNETIDKLLKWAGLRKEEEVEEPSEEDRELFTYFREKYCESSGKSWLFDQDTIELGTTTRDKAKEFSDKQAAMTELTDFLFDVRGMEGRYDKGYWVYEGNIGAFPDIAKKIADHYDVNDNEVLGRVLETAKEKITEMSKKSLTSLPLIRYSFQGINQSMMETVLDESGSAEEAVERVGFYLDKMAQVVERAAGGREGRMGSDAYSRIDSFLRSSFDIEHSVGFKQMVELSKELSSTPEEFEEVYSKIASAIEGKQYAEYEIRKLKSVIAFAQTADAFAKKEGASREQRLEYVQRFIDGFQPHHLFGDGVYNQSFRDTLAEKVNETSSEKHPSKAELFVSTAVKLAQDYETVDRDGVNIIFYKGLIFRKKSWKIGGSTPENMYESGLDYIAKSKELSGSFVDLVHEEKKGLSRITKVAQGIGLLKLLDQEKILSKYLKKNMSNPEKAREGLYRIAETAFARYEISAEHVKRPGDWEISNAERKDIIATAKRLAKKYDVRRE
ncbi:MAG: hypothetical protein ACXABK_04760 [Candidatus Heimdallarchaeaceae archaeon]|jgi:regulator of replication initiation timing